MPARMTDPAVGASTCASGSQVWTGHIGSFTANEAKNANQAHVCSERGNSWCSSVAMSVVPELQYSAMMASSISTDPRNVYKKNLNAAYTRRGPPQMPMIKNIGTS